MNGIILVDKPAGWTSHDVVAKLRGALKIKRVGHGGTLDPMATGLLPVFAGRATRAAGFSENAVKEYTAGLKLGVVTDTQDITGKIISSGETAVTRGELEAVLKRFIGEQEQTPPMYSAVRQDGKRLYELARRGIEVERRARAITVSELELLGGEDGEFMIRAVCSKGTYIRTLCNDIGAALGCGGTMSSLRRTRAGAFSIDAAHCMDDILGKIRRGEAEEVVIPTDELFLEYPAAAVGEAETRALKNGATCRAEGLTDGIYRIYAPGGEFLLLGELSHGAVKILKSFYEV